MAAVTQCTMVHVEALAPLSCFEVEPHSDMQQAVRDALDKATHAVGGSVQLQAVKFRSSNQPVQNWEQRKVGAEPITVLVTPPLTMQQILEQMSRKLEALERGNAARDEPRMRNTAAKLLRIACGVDSFSTSSSTRFKHLGPDHPSVIQLAKAMDVSAPKLVQQADAVLDRRNAAAHPGTVADLDAEVALLKELITREHEQRYAWECKLIKSYEHVKAAFPKQFTCAE